MVSQNHQRHLLKSKNKRKNYYGRELERIITMEFEKLKKIIADVLNVDPDEITMDTTFLDDLGADSLDVFQIIMGIE